MKKTKKITLMILIILLLSMIFHNSYAIFTTVTKDNLDTAIQGFVESNLNEGNYKITVVSDNTITVTDNGKSYSLTYDLLTRPKFSIEFRFERGMNYEEFKDKIDKLNLPMLGYIAVANIQGETLEDATTYFLLSYLDNALNDGGIAIENSDEFGDKVIKYINEVYRNKRIEMDKLSTYEWVVEKYDISETACKIISTLTVNPNADFSKIKEESEQLQENISNENVTIDSILNTNIENNTIDDNIDNNNNNNSSNNSINSNKNNVSFTNINANTSSSDKDIPKTGVSNIIPILTFLSIVTTIIYGLKLKEYKNK